MNSPLVTVCLPNLNNRRFLHARLQSIFAQTLTDWELVIVDNLSTDGAWEFFQDHALKEPRIRLSQASREGMYANWNNCLRLARGEFIYVATSDDDMAPDCLEKLSNALQARPDCDLAHCPLKVVDEAGVEKIGYWRQTVFVESAGGLIDQPHLRRVPYDGLLHLIGGTLYISITQLLFRRSLLDKIGFFDGRWGSMGDFHWGLRAGLASNVIHVPDTWGGWRIHPAQATNSIEYNTPAYLAKLNEMVDDALECSSRRFPNCPWISSVSIWKNYFRAYNQFRIDYDAIHNRWIRVLYLSWRLIKGDTGAFAYLRVRFPSGRGFAYVVKVVRGWMWDLKIVPVSAVALDTAAGFTVSSAEDHESPVPRC